MSKIVNISNHAVETTLMSTKKSRANQTSFKKEEILMKKLVDFYSYSTNLEQLLPILLKKSKISLRILDWFVTNYAKEFNVCYNIVHLGRVKRFSVYDSYKAQLKAFHKKLFDPFCRRRRIYFEYCAGSEIETTVGQLNFFKWAIQNKVLDYVETHLERISTHMSIKNKEKTESEIAESEVDELEETEIEDVAVQVEGEISKDKDTIVAKIGFTK